ncbi:MAG: ABC transporter ATP-binding protein [Longimicrobiales bacterium]
MALREVSLTIPRGRITAVIGPNGAGKSTLFGLVLGFLRPTSGDVTIEDSEPRHYVHEHGVGYISERFSLPPGWPVDRAIAALGGLNGLPPSRIDETLGSFGLSEHRHKSVGSLSRGLLQRLGLAQAFAARRDLIVLDEPAIGLDPEWRIKLRDCMTAQRDEGRTVLLASHDLDEVERIADTIIMLEAGAVKDILDTAGSHTATGFRIQLAHVFARVSDIFPDAVVDGASFSTTVRDAEDLNNRLAALIDIGGRIVGVTPDTARLEDRVRRELDT